MLVVFTRVATYYTGFGAHGFIVHRHPVSIGKPAVNNLVRKVDEPWDTSLVATE
jgi:hypothetical protein